MGAKGVELSLSELRRRLREGAIAPVYLLLGGEFALRRRALEALVGAVVGVGKGEAPGAYVRLDAARIPLHEILDEARSLPLFAPTGPIPNRLVWVSGFGQVFASRRRRDGVEEPKECETGGEESLQERTAALLEYLAHPVPECCLVLEATQLTRGSRVFKALAKCGTVVDCERPTRVDEVRRWIEATVSAQGHAIDRDALVYLLELVGHSITALEHELEKAMLYVGPGGRIDTPVLEGLTGRSREHSVFELTDALIKRRDGEAVRVLNRLLDEGEHPLRLLPMVAWITRQLVIAHDLSRSGCSRKEMLGSLAGRWNQRGEILERARHCARGDLMAALVACAEADLSVKRLRDARPSEDKLRPARGTLEALCRQICAA